MTGGPVAASLAAATTSNPVAAVYVQLGLFGLLARQNLLISRMAKRLAVQADSAAPLILANDVSDESNDRRQLAPMGN